MSRCDRRARRRSSSMKNQRHAVRDRRAEWLSIVFAAAAEQERRDAEAIELAQTAEAERFQAQQDAAAKRRAAEKCATIIAGIVTPEDFSWSRTASPRWYRGHLGDVVVFAPRGRSSPSYTAASVIRDANGRRCGSELFAELEFSSAVYIAALRAGDQSKSAPPWPKAYCSGIKRPTRYVWRPMSVCFGLRSSVAAV